ncbi:hypothetical protein HF086_014625 [Spodoptera exigua]|uniref:Uncharacterized protein n=1 Tax=Spodoptera exigua TaxID=7107 RepID=A0A922M5W0_SPOEX|nr:hypothetical protein HF086_014625 [Spodoptera exigua]
MVSTVGATTQPEPVKGPNLANNDVFVTMQRRKRRLWSLTSKFVPPNRCTSSSSLHGTTKVEDILEYVRQKIKYAKGAAAGVVP